MVETKCAKSDSPITISEESEDNIKNELKSLTQIAQAIEQPKKFSDKNIFKGIHYNLFIY